jgi:hypothetical protein
MGLPGFMAGYPPTSVIAYAILGPTSLDGAARDASRVERATNQYFRIPVF